MSVSIRVVNSIYGRPAAGVSVDLSCEREGSPVLRWHDLTDDEGRISGMPEPAPGRGFYTLVFDLDDYFGKLGYSGLNSAISIRFHAVSDTEHYGLFLLISPASCVAYRED
jgi:5-hydroxyisourate hydrolase